MSLLSLAKKIARADTEPQSQPPATSAEREPAEAAADRAAAVLHPLTVMLEPLLSEKSSALQEQGVATFRVPHNVGKHQVALAVAQRYGVRVRRVHLIRMLPKMRRRGNTLGRTAEWKKAYVSVDNVQQIITGP
ncbi:MAG: 50S ribosomal protein L23 [Candidatus Andersenbacteria bacterium CG10_big_fil_rev_8_21_14_0_10_54_11]|uniref:Large ribosomal subunit protein uL23 n=1 Tax=Candidatus Andersenbacteria bacterium CG10_big_fil_rev_8_21_14_0_10_54_11 TaxID=1974485 RepID=A0A2M6WYV2_9BACT|nr:MAG: 50S ribosomal protein L23 [Candidatus Andersenbacteria bacterium CG10_big_fil_rev_8_21_14_0_10_54_11]